MHLTGSFGKVLSEYPEVKLSNDQQKSSLGEDLLRSDEKSALTGESLPMTKGHGDDVTQILHANRGD